jgi:peptidoglycan/LPS O-acetylase OafA/YrhL
MRYSTDCAVWLLCLSWSIILCETHFGLEAAHALNHGYLAVDFFFALSGFVMGYAYDDRWDRMTTWGSSNAV